MVARSGGYYVPPFKEYHGVTQGDPLSPTLFNVVVDAVTCHWVTVVEATEADPEGLGLLIWYLAEYFYSNDVLIASTQPERLQRFFGFLTGFFVQVSLSTNTCKTVSMAFQPYHAPVRMSVETYESLTTGTCLAFGERHRIRLQCPEFGVDFTAWLLLMHHQRQNGMGRGDRGGAPPSSLPGRLIPTGSPSQNGCFGSSSQYRGA